MKYCLLLLLCAANFSPRAQVNPGLINILQSKFSADVANNEEWIFYKDSANFERLDYPLVKQYLPNYELYSAYLHYKVRPHWQNRWLIFYDSTNKDYILQPSLTMSELNPKLQSKLQNLQFTDSNAMVQFINAFHSLRQLGSKCKFIQTAASGTLLTYDVVWFDDQNHLSRPYYDTKQTEYNPSKILWKYKVQIANNRIKAYEDVKKTKTITAY